MRALVIGGNRYFGKRLVNLLLNQGVETTVLNRGSKENLLGNRIRQISADRRDSAALSAVVRDFGWDVVFDQACFTPLEAASSKTIFEGKTEKYIFTSSMSVYDEGASLKEEQYDPFSHRFDLYPNLTLSYAEGKRQAEAVFFQKPSFSVVAVRFPIVLGSDDYTGRLDFHIEKIRDSKPIYFPNPQARLSLIKSADAARFLLFLAGKNHHGPLNMASAEPIVLQDFVSIVEDATGKKAKISTNPHFGEPSPFGISSDYYMDVTKAGTLGFQSAAVDAWLPELVRQKTI